MLTLITGTPGAGKTLYAVWELARKVPGSTVEQGGDSVPRRLCSNIKKLVLDHQVIDASNLDTWQDWAQPADVILFDEVQEVWRPRGLGMKVPECIAALETHRHRGVDIILITQHPMLVDPNIRRLVNQHLHLRRITRRVAMVYEWDHCANPGQIRTALNSRVWFHPRKAYELYQSAQLHTKTTARLPRIAYLAVPALAGFAYMGSTLYGRMTERLSPPVVATKPASPAKPVSEPNSGPVPVPASIPGGQVAAMVPAGSVPVVPAVPALPKLQGCAATAARCMCFDQAGQSVSMPVETCRTEVTRASSVVFAPGARLGL